jgi:chemotaxis protein MotB
MYNLKHLAMFQTVKSTSIVLSFLVALWLSGCVSANKYERLNAEKIRYQGESEQCKQDLAALNTKFDSTKEELEAVLKRYKKIQVDSTQNAQDLDRLQRLYKDLTATYENLLKNHERLASNSEAEQSKLSKDLALKEKTLLSMEASLMDIQAKNQKLSDELTAREARVKELEKVLADKEQAVKALRSQIADALLSFKESDLTVQVKNGKVYVSMTEQLLFKSGSYAVDPKGRDALKKIAGVLRNQKEVSIMVEGHTDDVPVSKGTAGMTDNWDLSVLRANSIVRILEAEGVAPASLIAAGRSQYSPLDTGKSKEARTKNRRTELILTPRLDDLFRILE